MFNIVSGRKNKPSYGVLNAIISSNDIINPNWLLTGEGEMLKSLENPKEVLEDLENQIKELHKFKDKYYSILEMNSKLMKKNIKLLEKLLDIETEKI